MITKNCHEQRKPLFALPTILFVVLGLDTGGTERQLYSLINRLHNRMYSCVVFALDGRGVFADRLKNLGVPIYSGGLTLEKLKKNPWKLPIAMLRLTYLVHCLRPEIVHSFFPLMTFMGSLSGRMAGAHRVIISRRSLSTYQKRHPLLKIADRWANRLSHRVLVNSKAVWNDIVQNDRLNPAKIRLIYNGVDVDRYESLEKYRTEVRRELGINEQEKVIIMVANLITYKGHHDLLQAVKWLTKYFLEITVLLVGEDRGIEDDLEKSALALGISKHIRFLGLRSDIHQLLGASDLSVLPSHEEGFSNVILESMAAGLPVVATRVGGNAEAVVDGITGWLVSPGDPIALAHKIVDLLNDPAKARQWGERGKMRVTEHFSIEEMIKQHLKIYGNVLKRYT